MARPTKAAGPHIFWRNGRAYADLRAYKDVGGKKEALASRGSTWGTKDPDIALLLFEARLTDLRARRKDHAGMTRKKTTSLVELVRHHLISKAEATNTSDQHMRDLETRLRSALAFFGQQRDPRTIEPVEVRAWSDDLSKSGTRKPGTIRHYLNALSGLYSRAQEGLYVEPGYNPVAALMEKPTGHGAAEARFFEVADAALLLEASRIVQGRNRGAKAAPGLHAIIATFLLTGGRSAEVLGLDVDDVSFDRELVRFRPNRHRGLKTKTSVRNVPLWPQLREILQRHVFERGNVSGLLFAGAGGERIGDLRKSLDAMGTLCDMDVGEVRTRAFRHTYCSARLQTVERILRPGRDQTDDDGWDFVEVSRFQVQKEMGHGGAQLVDRIYGHAARLPYRSDVVEYRVTQHRDTLGDRLRALEVVSA